MMTYYVRHCYTNPRNNYEVECDTTDDLRQAMMLLGTDNPGEGSSVAYRDEEVIGERRWDEDEVTWFEPLED